jgi:hypothetical protein
MPTKKLDLDARLDYTWDFGSWMPAGDYIASHQLLPQAGITFEDDQVITSPTSDVPATAVHAWVQWDGAAVGERLGITCRITTIEGRVDDKTLHFLAIEG